MICLIVKTNSIMCCMNSARLSLKLVSLNELISSRFIHLNPKALNSRKVEKSFPRVDSLTAICSALLARLSGALLELCHLGFELSKADYSEPSVAPPLQVQVPDSRAKVQK